MKINNFGVSGMNPYKRQLNNLEQAEKAVAGKKLDKVEISSAAKELQYVSSPDTERQMKVDELKLQVENGTYKPNPKEIAESITKFYKK